MLTELFNVYSVRQTDDRASEAPLSASFRDFVAAERAVLELRRGAAVLDDDAQ